MFLGVSGESKVYKMYDPITRKIIISRDVQFDERSTWDWRSTNTHQNTVNHDADAIYEEIEEQSMNGQRIEPQIMSSDNDNEIEEQLQSLIGDESLSNTSSNVLMPREHQLATDQRQRKIPA